MNRRNFVKKSVITGSLSVASGSALLASAGYLQNEKSKPVETKEQFKMKFAPHFGMFRNHADDLLDQLQFMADAGFRAMEDNGMKGRTIEMQEKIASKMGNLGMEMGVFVAHTIYWKEPNLASGNVEKREEFIKEIKESVEVAKRVNAKWMTVVPGHVDLRKKIEYQSANVIESLKQASEILEPHGLVMVLEPLNFYNHPGLFLERIPQAYEICKTVNSPS